MAIAASSRLLILLVHAMITHTYLCYKGKFTDCVPTVDAAGLSIATSLNANARIFGQANRNVSDGISMLNIADGALDALSEITSRQLELAAKAANGVYGFAQRKAMNTEANALVDEYNRIVASTQFNGKSLFDMTTGENTISIQAGIDQASVLTFTLGSGLARTVGTGSFNSVVTIATANTGSSTGVALSDLNGDGSLDLAIAGSGGGGRIQVSLNDGSGTFTSSTSYVVAPSASTSVQFGDLNNDGKQDIVASGYDTGTNTYQISVFIGNGNGTFKAMTTYSQNVLPLTADALTLVDVNRDGFLDAITAGQTLAGTGNIDIMLGNGDGTFRAAVTYLSDTVYTNAIATADINNDLLPDIITAGRAASNSTMAAFLNTGDGHFSLTSSMTYGGSQMVGIAAADLNGDGIVDIVGGNLDNGSAYVAIGNGNGTFKAASSYSMLFKIRSVELGDVNGDGISDLTAIGNDAATTGFIAVRLGDGRGSFGAVATYHVSGWTALGLAIGDLTGDQAQDIAFAGTSASGGPGVGGYLQAISTQTATMPRLSLFNQSDARTTLDILQNQINRISSEKAGIGAFLSRLEIALNNLSTYRENLIAAASRITDADIADESSQLIRQQILQQAGAAVLAQANQQPSLALKLIGGLL